MHPFAWWHARHGGASCGEGAGCGPHGGGGPWHARGRGGPPFGGHGGGDEWGGGGFGVRRPLRFLAWKLELEEEQVAQLAAVLDDLKTERAQAAVDDRRAVAALADAVAAESFDEAKVSGATGDRARSAERLQAAVAKALGRIHALLEPEQRSRFAYLLRTGALGI
ncbi:MAG TPA: Spy/CpxP family protein refolding chaperone [Polyangiaceae bacterium]